MQFMRRSAEFLLNSVRALLSGVLCVLMVEQPMTAAASVKKVRPSVQQIQGDERVLHVLNRFTFGPRPGDVAAARAMAASNPVVPQTPQLEPAEKRRVANCISICTLEFNRTLTTFGRRVLDSMASISVTWLTSPSPYSRPAARYSSSPGVLMVVPNETGSIPSAGWCYMYSRGASTATRSSFCT